MIEHATHEGHSGHNGHAADSYYIDGGLWTRGRNVIVFIALVSWIAAIAGFLADPARFFQSYLVGFIFCVTIPLGAMFFVMMQYLTGSAWSVPMRRIAENIAVSIPVGGLLFIGVALGIPYLYEWSHADVVAKDAVLSGKAGYLNPQWFIIRAVIYFVIWTLWSNRLHKNSTEQDRTGSLDNMHAASRWSAPGLLLTTVTVTLAAFDWSMSLDPHWYSTIFGLYVFAGGALAFMAVWTLICLGLRSKGVLKNTINVEHYHDLGKWMFALTIFWAYIAFSQYLLIWYANLPEETIWYRHRMEGTWKYWSALVLVGHFIVPFLVLLPRASKRNFKVLAFAAWWILAMHFVDTYFQVMPTFNAHGIAFHWLDVVCVVAPASVFALVFWARVRNNALLPIGDPRFEQGLEFQNV
jgi:hypothetical protein